MPMIAPDEKAVASIDWQAERSLPILRFRLCAANASVLRTSVAPRAAGGTTKSMATPEVRE
jgi:hypothetical protein